VNALVSDGKIEKSMALVMETEKEKSREATGVYDSCVLQYTARHCNTLQHAATRCNTPVMENEKETSREDTRIYDSFMLQHTVKHCNALQHAGDGNGEGDCNALHHTAPHCTTLQYDATYCNTLKQLGKALRNPTGRHDMK